MTSSEDLTSGFYDDEPTHWFSCFSLFFSLFSISTLELPDSGVYQAGQIIGGRYRFFHPTRALEGFWHKKKNSDIPDCSN